MEVNKNGEERIIDGEKIIILEYASYKDCTVLLSDGTIQHMDYRGFLNRKIPYGISEHSRRIGKEKSKNRLGEERTIDNKTIKIIRYNNNHDIDILMADGEVIKNSRYDAFIKMKSATMEDRLNRRLLTGKKNKGRVLNSEHRQYDSKLDSLCVDEFGNFKRSYKIWNGVLNRSFDNNYKEKNQTYSEVSCCEEWMTYSNFEAWYNENYYEINKEKMELDKDILIKGNKLYSPETCIFVPHKINTLFVKNDKNRNLLIGVHRVNNSNRFVSKISKNGKRECLGTFNTEIEAFNAYKIAKEKYIKEVADEYKLKYANFPQKLYDAMYSYQVERTD